MSESRALLKEALQQALQSDDRQPSHLDILMDRYPFLCRTERGALVHLSNWQADKGLRQFSPKFAEYSKQRLHGFLSALD